MTYIPLPVLESSPPCPILHRRSQRIAYRYLLHRESSVCFYCGVALSKTRGTLDHVIPLARGGTHRPENLVLCCRGCNTAKRDRTCSEWLADLCQAWRRLQQPALPLLEGVACHVAE